jgi:hypothetical protein
MKEILIKNLGGKPRDIEPEANKKPPSELRALRVSVVK